MSLGIKKGDRVMVIAGKYKGQTGTVLEISPRAGKAIVEGMNIAKKHQKARSQQDQGGIREMEKPLLINKLMLVGGKDSKPARFATQVAQDGSKTRVLKLRDEKEVTV